MLDDWNGAGPRPIEVQGADYVSKLTGKTTLIEWEDNNVGWWINRSSAKGIHA